MIDKKVLEPSVHYSASEGPSTGTGGTDKIRPIVIAKAVAFTSIALAWHEILLSFSDIFLSNQ